MTEKKRKTCRSLAKLLVRTLGYMILGLSLLVAGAFLILQIRPVQDAVTDTITKTLTSAIATHTRAVCRIEKLSGNLLSGFTCQGVSLTDAATGDLLLKVQELEISYILPLLLEKTLWINRLSVSGLSVALVNPAGDKWNFDVLSPSPSSPPKDAPPKPQPPALSEFKVRLRHLDIRDSDVLISVSDDSDGLTPQVTVHRFTGIEYRGRVDMKFGKENDISADIEHLAVSLNLPRIDIIGLSGKIHCDLDETRFDFNNTAIKGKKSDFTINGSLAILENAPDRALLDQIVLDLRAHVDAMSLGEFGRAFPIEMPDTDIVRGNLSAKGPVSRMDCQVDLQMDQCHVVSQGLVGIDENYDVSLDLDGKINGLDLAALPVLELTFLPGDLNTDGFTLNWRDIGMPEQTGRIVLHLTPSVLSGYAIDEAEITTEIHGPDMNFKPLYFKTPYGEVSGTLNLVGIMYGEEDKQIEIVTDIKNLNPAKLLKNKRFFGDNDYNIDGNIGGNLQTTIRIPGTYDTEGITAEAAFRMNTSKVMGLDIRKADVEVGWGEKTFTVKRLDLTTAFGSASFSGDASIKDRTWRLKAGADLPDLAFVRPYISGMLPGMAKDTALSGNVSLTADVTGPWDQPDIAAAISGESLAWDTISADSLTAEGRWNGAFRNFTASADAGFKNMRMGGFQAPVLNISTLLTPAAIHATVDLQGSRKEQLTLSGDIRQWMEPVKTIEITKMALTAFEQPPLVNQGPVILTLSPDLISVDSLSLASGPATIGGKGQAQLTPPREVSAALTLRDVDLIRISGFLAGGDKLKGRISSDVRLSGVLDKPMIQMDMSLKEASFDKYSISEATASIAYSDSRAALAASVGRNGSKLVVADGSAFVSLSLFPFAFSPGPESLDIRLDIDDADISWISDLINHPEYGVTGRLSATANVSGDFFEPRIEGRMRLAEGTLNLKKQGLTYETLTADLQFDKDAITINEVILSGDKEGELRLSGVLTHDRFTPLNFDLQAAGKMVYIPFHGGVQAWVNPNLTLSGDWANPKVEGKIKVVRGRVNLDRFLARQPSEIKIVSPVIAENGLMEIPDEELEPLAFVDPLTADITLNISKDCWLRGRDAQVEIKGNVQLKKDPRKPFVLFGSLNTVRGTYRFRGKLFQITQGELMFVGQEDLNPPVNIEAQTEIDDAAIMIRLTGTFEHLNLTFDSDPPMDQAEIVSYILFGRGTDALSEQETFKAEEMALSFTGQIAADKLKDIVGDALGIDYLNISTGGSELRQGSLSMGKYVLPKVFVVFRQGFSDQNSQQFEVSYEINKYFDIQSQIDNEQTSALDLIWKYEF
ncbi:MAG: translocation/assembly module TamB domain-containing protein [Desulfosalsimonadaceae bacterium]